MKIRNVSPQGDLDVPLLGRIVAKGEVFDVPAEHAELLLAQPYHYKKAAAPKARPVTKKEGETK